MKFIFPQNYNFKNKLFGILDYNTAIINIAWCLIVLISINLFFDKKLLSSVSQFGFLYAFIKEANKGFSPYPRVGLFVAFSSNIQEFKTMPADTGNIRSFRLMSSYEPEDMFSE